MWSKKLFCIFIIFGNFLHYTNGCTIPGIPSSPGILSLSVKDIDKGVFYRVTTQNIISITSSGHSGDELRNGPYITAALENNDFILSLHENFEQYEEYETTTSMGFTVQFSCNGNPSIFVVVVMLDVIDTNNNKPIFTPAEVSFTTVLPMPPGFKITGCNNQIVVRDIDLTTRAIIFGIEENDYFEILFDEASTVPNSKTFLGIVRTKSFVRSIPNPITLEISATDVDGTGDAPHTTYTSMTITGDPSFTLPDDLIFTEPFYLATYTEDHKLNLQRQISLQQGFDEEVRFTLTGDKVNHFRLTGSSNSRSIEVSTELPVDVLNENSQILLVVTAERQHVSSTTATIVIELPQTTGIEFESMHYEGKIVDNILTAPNLILKHGYEDDFAVEIISDYSSYFQYTIVERNQIHLQMTQLTEDILINNNFITLHIKAKSEHSSTTALLILDIIKDDLTTPMFGENTYTGTYDRDNGLVLEDIILVQGFDDAVEFGTEGEHGQFFKISPKENRISLTPIIPNEILEENNQLVFTVLASKPRTVGARSTVIVNLPTELTIPKFEYSHYRGLIQGDMLTLAPITLSQGYSEDIKFELRGEYASHFRLNTNNAPTLTLELNGQLPDSVEGLIILELRSSGLSALTAFATIVLETPTVTDIDILNFGEAYYSGSFTQEAGLDFTDIITLASGYDDSVSFKLDGSHSQYFICDRDENSITLSVVPSGIPIAVLNNNLHLTFSILAERPGAHNGRAAIVIALPDDFPELTILKFEHTSYRGSIEEDKVILDPIVLIEGYSENIAFEISGEYASHFRLNANNAPTLTLELNGQLPDSLEGLIILELRSSGSSAVTAFSTIVLETPIVTDIDILNFSEAYYSGSFTQEAGLDFTEIITLASGYDDSVSFKLDGSHSQYFICDRDENSITLSVVPSGIPIAVLNNNLHLTFSILAERPGAHNGRAAIVIALPDDFPELTILKFEHTSYRGSIEEDKVILDPIVLIEGYSENIAFEISGEYASHFRLNTNNAPTLTLELNGKLPDSLEGLIILELRSSGSSAVTAFATIVLETPTVTDIDILNFSEAYYSGSYTQEAGLDFTDIITLASGYDDSVSFKLDGSHSQYFICDRDENSITLSVVPSGIPIAVLNNNLHLTFSILAERPGAHNGRAAIVIALPDDFPELTILKFEHTSYRGSIEEDKVILDPIVLIEGYSENIAFEISGEYASHFRLNANNAPTLTLELNGQLPDSLEGLIILELRSSGSSAVTAFSTIVLETPIVTDIDILNFSEAYYSGSFTQEAGLDFTEIITLASGYDDSISFKLDGSHSQYFICDRDENSITLSVVPSGIPIAVLNNNLHLTFSILAERPGAHNGRAAIVIALPDDFPELTILKFEHTSYRGSIEEDKVILDPIVLIEGYSENIAIEISGEYASHFRLNTNNAPTLTLELNGKLPDSLEGLIILELRSSGSSAVTAFSTIVLETPIVTEIDVLNFSEAYYSGSFTQEAGLDFTDIITLASGYDDSVSFKLDGSHSQYFICDRDENSITLSVVPSGIPIAVLNNNLHLTFSILAERPGAHNGRAAIVIALPDDFPELTILKFEHTSYRGSIEEDKVILDRIVLIEGYSENIAFEISGEYASHFRLNANNAPTLTLELNGQLPDSLEGLIILELRSSGSSAVTAFSTIVLETPIVTDIDILNFSEAYYSGSFTQEAGLDFTEIITLAIGYDDSVSFKLDGSHSQYFICDRDENSITLSVVPSGIPIAVLNNNLHLTFSILAERPGAHNGRAAIVIALPDDFPELTILKFEHTSYRGSIEEDKVILDPIVLIEGYSENIAFQISGEYASHFRLNTNNAPTLTLELNGKLPDSLEGLIILELRSSGSSAVTAYSTIVLETPIVTEIDVLNFSEAYYSGSFTQEAGLDFTDIITLASGYDDSVSFKLDGSHSQYFICDRDENSITLSVVPSGIPIAVLNNNLHLTFSILAERPGAHNGRAAIVIALPDDFPELTILKFEHTSYRGSIEEDKVILDPIVLIEGYSENIAFEISGEYASHFRLNTNNAPTLTLELNGQLPDSLEGLIILELRSSGSSAVTAFSTIVLETPIVTEIDVLNFSEAYYSGSFTQKAGLDFTDIITLASGYDNSVSFKLDGSHSQYFVCDRDENSITLSVVPSGIPIAVLNNNLHLTFSILAERPGAHNGRAAIVIALPDDFPELTILKFEHISYRGSIKEDKVILDPIVLIEGYSENIAFEISGEYASHFRLNTNNAPTLTLELNGQLPDSLEGLIILELRSSGSSAVTAFSTIVLETPIVTEIDVLNFSEAYYSGSYTQGAGLDFTDIITLASGYDDSVSFKLDGSHSQYFVCDRDENLITLSVVPSGIPIAVLNNNLHLTFSILAERPGAHNGRAAIVIALPDGPSADVFFLRALYRGIFELGTLQHDDITLVGYSGSEIEICGEWSELFKGVVDNGQVHIKIADDAIIPVELLNVALELRADVARTAIAIDILHRDESLPPEVEFNPQSYVFRVDVTNVGIIGLVSAVTNNGESVQYSLEIDNDHLNERLMVNSRGEIHLTAPANPGRYHFNIVATTSTSGVNATANGQLTVDAITVCGEGEFVIPPLIIIERDEEESHDNLVVVNEDIADKCYYEMSNHWPIDQTWLTVDSAGLHAKKIDREDESIAFMSVSQIQVELTLHCADDNAKRTKRSTLNHISNSSKVITPNEYGSKRWILTDPILHNSRRRSFVNLIVNDINDNSPIFKGKENEPIVVGYPQLEILDIVRPRALAELQATDKDIGINAKLVYWSDASILAVARETGTVHIRNNMADLLRDNTEYIIRATDKDGAPDGNDGSIRILVKVLDIDNIAVLTISDAFLDDEKTILYELSQNLNYDVRTLRSTVISANLDTEQLYKTKREGTEGTFRNGGASLQLYVYGLLHSTPISASQLVSDINSSGITTVKIVNNLVLEDHIQSNNGNHVGLLAATITLSIILFLIIVFAVFWYFYKIRRANNYEKFSDTKSLSNQSNVDAEILKIENIPKPKINIDKIKKSERRLQEILNTPAEDISNTPHSSTVIPSETIIDIPVVEKNAPLVIQSIDKLKDAHDSDDEDEFGELKSNPRRKSVVTFNENVEKIIHVEDDIDDTESVPDYEVNRL